MKKTRLAINSIAHLVVDMACFYVLYAYIANSNVASSSNMQLVAVTFLVYDFIAFGLQFILGSIYDKLPKMRLACIGIALVFIGVLLKNIPMAAMILVALGNAAFHVGGGADTLKESDGFCESGVFVSFGALGVYFGTLSGKSEIGFVAILCALAVCGIGELVSYRYPVRGKEVKCVYEKKVSVAAVIAVLMVAIIVRAVSGGTLPKPSGNVNIAAIAVVYVFFGKLSGGFIADALSPKITALSALLLASLLGAFDNVICCLMALTLFNMAMPITLYALYSALPGNAGFAFGLTTLGLLIGTIPAFCFSFEGVGRVLFVVSNLVVAVGLTIVLKGRERNA